MFEPHVSLGLLSCAAVSTAHWLGAGWASTPWLGMPLGMWVVGGVVGAAVLWERRGTAPRQSGAGEGMVEAAGRARRRFGEGLTGVVRRFLSHPIYAFGTGRRNEGIELGPELVTPGYMKAERAPRAGKTEAVPRIGVSGPEEYVEAFVEQAREESELDARFEPVAAPVREPEDCAKRALAGAVSFSELGQTAIVLPEHRGRGAAWSDWSQRLALSYPAVFPPRVDPARIVCGPVRIRSAREARLIARMAEASSLLSQVEARTGARRSAEWLAAHHNRISRAMTALARTFTADWGGHEIGQDAAAATPVCRAAARAISAWLSMHDNGIDAQERRQWVEACSAYLGDEPESHLRLAAARIGAFEDDEAMVSLGRAFQMMRVSGEQPLSDPLAFVLAEMEVGSSNSMALGRVAAGLAIAWATTPAASLDYLRDDLIDDLRYSARLLGRDQDHAFLKRVMGEMDRLRSESMTMPVRAAA